MLQVQVRAYFYHWKPHISLEGEEWPFTAWELKISDGLMSANQLLLRMPTTMVHVIDDDSPLAAWCTGRAAVATDSDSEIVVVVSPSTFLPAAAAHTSCPVVSTLAARTPGRPVSACCLCVLPRERMSRQTIQTCCVPGRFSTALLASLDLQLTVPTHQGPCSLCIHVHCPIHTLTRISRSLSSI